MYSRSDQTRSLRPSAIAGVRPPSDLWTRTQLYRSHHSHSDHCNRSPSRETLRVRRACWPRSVPLSRSRYDVLIVVPIPRFGDPPADVLYGRMAEEDFRALTPLIHAHVNPYGPVQARHGDALAAG
jgi:hypothetical protein